MLAPGKMSSSTLRLKTHVITYLDHCRPAVGRSRGLIVSLGDLGLPKFVAQYLDDDSCLGVFNLSRRSSDLDCVSNLDTACGADGENKGCAGDVRNRALITGARDYGSWRWRWGSRYCRQRRRFNLCHYLGDRLGRSVIDRRCGKVVRTC